MTSVYCKCGAQWHGPYVDGNLQIGQHERTHGLVSREEFVRLGFTDTGPRPRRPPRRHLHAVTANEVASREPVAPRPQAAADEVLTPQQELVLINVQLAVLLDSAQQLQRRLELLTITMPFYHRLVGGRDDGGDGPA